MKISSKMTVDGYINRVRKVFKKGNVLEQILKGSSQSSLDELKKANPAFLKAVIDYVHLAEIRAKQNYLAPQRGLAEDSSEERKALVKAFSVDTEDKRNLFYPAWYDTAFENVMYQILETVFDAGLILEQCAERRFRELWGFYNSFYKMIDGNCNVGYFTLYKNAVFHISLSEGKIYKLSCNLIDNMIKEYGIEGIQYISNLDNEIPGYYLVLKNKTKFRLYNSEECKLSGRFKCCNMVKDHNKGYLQVRITPSTEKEASVQFNAHFILMLAKYGIDIAKHLLLKDSLITVDHTDMITNDNNLINLQLITRRDNKLRAVSKDENILKSVYSYSLDEFFIHMENCFKMDKKDIKFKIDYLADYWNEKLAMQTAEEILLSA